MTRSSAWCGTPGAERRSGFVRWPSVDASRQQPRGNRGARRNQYFRGAGFPGGRLGIVGRLVAPRASGAWFVTARGLTWGHETDLERSVSGWRRSPSASRSRSRRPAGGVAASGAPGPVPGLSRRVVAGGGRDRRRDRRRPRRRGDDHGLLLRPGQRLPAVGLRPGAGRHARGAGVVRDRGTYTDRAESVAIGDITGDGRADVVLGLDGLGVAGLPAARVRDARARRRCTPRPTATRSASASSTATAGSTSPASAGARTRSASCSTTAAAGSRRRRPTRPARRLRRPRGRRRQRRRARRPRRHVRPGPRPEPQRPAQLAGGGFGPAAEYQVGGNVLTHGIGVGDVTGDGRTTSSRATAATGRARTSPSSRRRPGGTLAAPVSYASYDIPEPLDVADIDLDGRADVVTLHGGWNQAGVYRQTAGGTLAAEDATRSRTPRTTTRTGWRSATSPATARPDVVAGRLQQRPRRAPKHTAGTGHRPPDAPALGSAASGRRAGDAGMDGRVRRRITDHRLQRLPRHRRVAADRCWRPSARCPATPTRRRSTGRSTRTRSAP